ncbi:RrF2 family transcriptional regulator [Agrobacterium tumefaciens]|uniref:RrF2 family transcriptional regulator n=1 Tax=Agrobacterium tumefaciens TaxID=358 RepID=UPI003D9C0FB9
MRLSRQSEIAIGILNACALKRQEIAQTEELARQTGTTKLFAAQAVSLLVRGGFLRSKRGRGGGVALAHPAAEIRLGSVLRLTQGGWCPGVGRRPSARSNSSAPWPAFDRVLLAASDSFLDTFDDFTLADLAMGLNDFDIGSTKVPVVSTLPCQERCKLQTWRHLGRTYTRPTPPGSAVATNSHPRKRSILNE